MNAFFHFFHTHRGTIMELRPSMDIVQVAELLGKRWRSMPKKDKELYYRMAVKEKEDRTLEPSATYNENAEGNILGLPQAEGDSRSQGDEVGLPFGRPSDRTRVHRT